jgi:hypothetical protein
VKASEGRLLFVNKKKQKNFVNLGLWALRRPSLLPSIAKVFAALFSKSACFPFLKTIRDPHERDSIA